MVCASGSDQLVVCLLNVSLITRVSFNLVVSSLGTLVLTIVLSVDSIRPCAWNNVSAEVTSVCLSFVVESDSLNSLVPVLNFKVSFLGITKDPDTLPKLSTAKVPLPLSGCEVSPDSSTTPVESDHSTYDSDLQYAVTSTSLKNA